ncbi:hypothetical protein CG709_18340 [Lachnotalea glycerini]|nr:hypothetical protein CG709_18340 [Lachnotalea glycerini]
MSYVDPSGNQCQAAKDRLAASTSKGKNETKTSTKLAAHQDSSSKGAGGSEIKGGKNPNGYKAGDIDEHGFLSPGKNRADGNHNVANEGRVQSHHIIQDKWAQTNISGYQRNSAPAILLETGTGKPHTYITNSQRERRVELGYNTSIQSEFHNSYSELIDSGVNKKNAQKAIKDAYKYFDGLGAFD